MKSVNLLHCFINFSVKKYRLSSLLSQASQLRYDVASPTLGLADLRLVRQHTVFKWLHCHLNLNITECIDSLVICFAEDAGSSSAGGQWCPAPHFMFGPPVAAYIQYCI